MFFMSKKCERCGHRKAKRKRRGRNLCTLCLVRERADEERIRSCPVDGETMRKFIIKDIILDHCPVCRGLGLDGGEMAKIKHHAREEGDGFGAGFIAGMIIG